MTLAERLREEVRVRERELGKGLRYVDMMAQAADALDTAAKQREELRLLKAGLEEFREALKVEYVKHPSRAAGSLIKRLTRILTPQPAQPAGEYTKHGIWIANYLEAMCPNCEQRSEEWRDHKVCPTCEAHEASR